MLYLFWIITISKQSDLLPKESSQLATLRHNWKIIYPFQNWIEIQFADISVSYLFLQTSNTKPQLSTLDTRSPWRWDRSGVLTTASQWTEVHWDISAASVRQVQHAVESQWLSSPEADCGHALPLFHMAALWCGHTSGMTKPTIWLMMPGVPAGTSSVWRSRVARPQQGQNLWARQVTTSEREEWFPAHTEDIRM